MVRITDPAHKAGEPGWPTCKPLFNQTTGHVRPAFPFYVLQYALSGAPRDAFITYTKA